MPTIRRSKQSKWFSLARTLGQDNTLSYEAIGVMTYLLSKSDNWQAQLGDIERRGARKDEPGVKQIGRDRRQKIMAELEAAGYLERTRIYDAKTGQWDYELIVHEEPLPEGQRTRESRRKPKLNNADTPAPSTGNPSTVHQATVEPSTVSPSTVNPAIYIEKDVHNTELLKKEEENVERESVATPRSPHSSPAARVVLPKKPSEKMALICEIANHPIAQAIGFICDLPPWKDCRKTVLEQVKALAIRICNDHATAQDVVNFYDWKRLEKNADGQIHFILTYAIEDWRGYWAEYQSDPEMMEFRLNHAGRTDYGRTA